MRTFSKWLLAATAIAVAACAHRTTNSVSFTYHGSEPQNLASSEPPVRSYPVGAAFEHGGPPLTREQRAWIARILHSRNYGSQRSQLRFALVEDLRVPIVVYRAHMEKGIDNGGLIIGESCNSYFDPHRFGFVTTPGDVGCDENAKPVE